MSYLADIVHQDRLLNRTRALKDSLDELKNRGCITISASSVVMLQNGGVEVGGGWYPSKIS